MPDFIHWPFTDLLDSRSQLIALEKDDEDRLVDLVTLHEHNTTFYERTSQNTDDRHQDKLKFTKLTLTIPRDVSANVTRFI